MHPYLLHAGHLVLPTFGALAVLGLLLALALSQRTARLVQIDPEKLWDAGLFTVLAAFLLSRAFLVATNFQTFRTYPILLLAVPSLTPPGLLLTALATLLWLRYKHIPILRALDAWAPGALFVWAFLALGHFAEGSDPGLPTLLPTGIPMPGETTPLHPIALYAALVAFALALLTYLRLTRMPPSGRTAGHTAGLGLALAGLTQFLLSFLRQPGLATVFGLNLGLDLLQIVALALLITGLALLLREPVKQSSVEP